MKEKEVIKQNKCSLLRNLLKNKKVPFNSNNGYSLSIRGLIKAGIIIPIYKKHRINYLMLSNKGFNFLKSIFKPFFHNNKKLTFRGIMKVITKYINYYISIIITILLILLFSGLLNQINGVTYSAIFLSFCLIFLCYGLVLIVGKLVMSVLVSLINYYDRQPNITKAQFQYCLNQNRSIKWNNDLEDLFKIQLN